MNRSTLASKSEAKRFTWQRLMARYTLQNEGMLTTLQPTRHREKHPSQAPLSLATTSRNNKNRVPKIEMWRHVKACEHNVFSFESFISIKDAPPARLGSGFWHVSKKIKGRRYSVGNCWSSVTRTRHILQPAHLKITRVVVRALVWKRKHTIMFIISKMTGTHLWNYRFISCCEIMVIRKIYV